MKMNVVALAGALLALTAAAAQASPATVVPDTLHKIGSGATQVFNGTKKGVSDQYHHAVAAGRRTVRDARHGRLFHHHHHHWRHHHTWSHHHMASHHQAVMQGDAGAASTGASAAGPDGAAMRSHTHKVVKDTTRTSGPNPPAAPQG